MPTQQTFAQYLIESILPDQIKITKPIDKAYLKEILIQVTKVAPHDYPRIVMELKNLGDKLSTWEAATIGLDEIDVPNRSKRDSIINKYQILTKDEKDEVKVNQYLADLQNELADIDYTPGYKDGASLMLRSAIGGKKTQMMKLRTSPGVVGGHDGKIVNEIFPKSYAEGVDPLHFWLGAAESRKNLAQGQVSTSEPGELSKIISNVLNSAVVSKQDCGTKRGIELGTKDDDIQGRYLAAYTGKYSAGTLITSEVQQDLIRQKVDKVLVRSPQTCQAADGTVCAMCMGVRPGTGKLYEVGDNAGMVTAGSLSEVLTQASLSKKHSTAMAGQVVGLTGTKGIRQFAEMPENYNNRKILCEVYGRVSRIETAPQGGKNLIILQTQKVPDRYIVLGKKSKSSKQSIEYYIPPNIKLLPEVKLNTEVFPGMELTTGVDNVKDVARLQNLGVARSKSAQGLYDIYKNTGVPQARVHFELLARNAHPYVKIEKAPSGFDFKRGEIVDYNKLENSLGKVAGRKKAVSEAIGSTLIEGVLDLTAGTEVTPQIADRLIKSGIQTVKVSNQVSVSPATTPLSRVVNRADDWISALNHRHIKTQLKDAASLGKASNLHGYNPIVSYAYGTEMQSGEDGRY
jgi:DNA-directed RNA polymerase subunit beta'